MQLLSRVPATAEAMSVENTTGDTLKSKDIYKHNAKGIKSGLFMLLVIIFSHANGTEGRTWANAGRSRQNVEPLFGNEQQDKWVTFGASWTFQWGASEHIRGRMLRLEVAGGRHWGRLKRRRRDSVWAERMQRIGSGNPEKGNSPKEKKKKGRRGRKTGVNQEIAAKKLLKLGLSNYCSF